MNPGLRVGIDVGGTFTDLFAFDEASGAVHVHKVSSTPDDPHRAPVEGLRELLLRIGRPGRDVVFLGLGTTVATNAFLEGRTAPVGLITTRGFRDLLEIGRQTRPHLYDPFVRKPAPLVPRPLRCEVTERLAADGSVVAAPDDGDVQRAIAQLKQARVMSVAICFLNAYVDPRHELQVREAVLRAWPDIDVVASSDLIREFREYERFVSTVVNASLMPGMRAYFQAFEQLVAQMGITAAPVIVSSSGGVLTPAMAAARPIDTLFSGPSGGVSGAMNVSGESDIHDVVTFDMGGTSTEVCLVRHGTPQVTHRRTIKGYPIRTTSHDIHTIGAGGSSVAMVDAGGMLHVGPQSAGARPGPACYATGGELPTVTDANVVLGRLNPEYLLGGALPIDAGRSREAVRRHVGELKGLSMTQAAQSIVALAEANMAQAIRVVSVERGIDPANFLLVAFGGAGPLHACAVARQVGMAGVLVPLHPGVLCAMGVLTRDMELNLGRTLVVDTSAADAAIAVADGFAELEASALERLRGHDVDRSAVRFERSAALRYKGQNHEIDVDAPNADGLSGATRNFHSAHRELYGYAFEHEPVEFVTLRVAARIAVPRPPRRADMPRTTDPLPNPVARREVIFDDDRGTTAPVYARAELTCGHAVQGACDHRTDGCDGGAAARMPRGGRRAPEFASDLDMSGPRHLSPGTMEVVASAFEAATREMWSALIRTAYSPNVKERGDCSTALCDITGRTLSLTAAAPAHLGATLRLVPQIVKRFPLEEMAPGDAFLANDPYIVGVTHLNDCTVASPIFHGGVPVAFAIAVAHHSDVGGRVPGSEAGDSTSIFQEGLRVPPVKIYSAGVPRADMIELFLLNSRTPEYGHGDLMAQMAAVERGSRRVADIYARHGADRVTLCVNAMLDATERRMAQCIRENLDEGVYRAADNLDDDGISDRPVELAVVLTVHDGTIELDFGGSAGQIGSGKNVPLPHTLATAYFVLKMFTDPAGSINEGLFRVVRVHAPEGSIVNPVAPAAVSSRNATSMILADVMVDAFGQACPERLMAAGGPFQGTILAGRDPVRQRRFIDYENFSGGQGASPRTDGMDAVQIHMTNTSNLPIESMELEFPVRVERYELRCDSGGPGQHRGGLGVVRDIRILGEDVTVALRSARQRFAAAGRLGGGAGALGAFVLNPGSAGERRLPSTSSATPLAHGDVLRILTPGGGGVGDPAQRDRSALERDIEDEKVSAEAARKLYVLNTRAV